MQTNYDVLVVGGAPFKAYEWLKIKASQARCVIAVDRGGSYCLRAGITPDVLIGDFDSLTKADLASLTKKGTDVRSYSAEKDETDLLLALKHAKTELAAKRVLLVACTHGRLDHELAVFGACLAVKQMAIDFASPKMRAYLLRPRARGAITLPASNRHLSIISLSEHTKIQTLGLKWELHDEELGLLEDRGVSNEVVAERASLFCKKGAALIICI